MGRYIECEHCGKEKHDDYFEYPDICTDCIGSCRFNCRSQKEAFMAGWDASLAVDNPLELDEVYMANQAYKQWLKDKD